MAASSEMRDSETETMSFVDGDCETETASLSSSPLKLPRRLRRRLMVPKSPITAKDIEAKLDQAHVRRQKFYELLSSKARPKDIALSLVSKEEELNKRLEAKLNAAEQKRSSILERAQTRLAKLDELRKAAKADLETRSEKERDELSAKVKSKAKQAEENRARFVTSFSQRRAARRDRVTQLLTQKMVKERKYRDCVRASISQKRSAAERKRMEHLEGEKAKACSMILQVRRAVKSAHSKHGIEQFRAKKERAEILNQQFSSHLVGQKNSKMVQEQKSVSKIIRCWSRFVHLRKTTSALAKAYEAIGITEESVKSMSFEQLAHKIESSTAIQSTKALVFRLQTWYLCSLISNGELSCLENIDHLLKRVTSPIKKGTTSPNTKSNTSKEIQSSKEAPLTPVAMSRYPVRILLCAYVILGHPDVIFNRRTECENALALSASKFIREFELLLKIIKDGPLQMAQEETAPLKPTRTTFRSQLEVFDKAWCSYLFDFVAWKDNDSKLLADELVRAVCELELSMIQNFKNTPPGDNADAIRDTFQKQVSESQKLLRDKLQQLSGSAGLERLEASLSEIRSRYIGSNDTASSLASSVMTINDASLDESFVSDSPEASIRTGNLQSSRNEIRASVENDESHLVKQVDSASSSGTSTNDHQASVALVAGENELLVNEILHGHRLGLSDGVNVSNANQNSLEAKVRETMEKAFWDAVMESMKENDSNFSWILKLVTEVRDEIFDISPEAWKQEVVDAIDIDILSQALGSGNLDMDYFGRILEFALVMLRKLSAPASDDDMKTAHNKVLKELGEILQYENESKASRAMAITKGLRFVLEQIQNIKKEISKARLRIVEPFIKGTAGFEYLRGAFSNRHGPPNEAQISLPNTRQWLSSVRTVVDQEWHDYKESLLAVTTDELSSGLPPTTLRTGGSFSVGIKTSSQTSATNTTDLFSSGQNLPECEGERIDLLVRVGLLKLVSEVVWLSLETLPETLELNLVRLRAVQHQLQKIIVISTCLLILRQISFSDNLVTSPQEFDEIASRCIKKLSNLVDTVEEAGIPEIVETVLSFSEEDDDNEDMLKWSEKLQAKKQILATMLGKSLQSDDAIFKRVSRALYLAARGIVLGGSGARGRELAENSLRRVGAALLTDDLVKAVQVLIVAAKVTCNVHRPWYEELIKIV